MAPYQYRPLDPSQKEIRVLHLHPGATEDPIRISISHAPFRVPDKPYQSSRTREELEQLDESMPWDWLAWKTIEGRVIFEHIVAEQASDREDSDGDESSREYSDAGEPEEDASKSEELNRAELENGDSEVELSDKKVEFPPQTSDGGSYTSWMPPIPIQGFHSDEGDFLRRRTASPHFEALSYTWGPVETFVPVEVVDRENPFQIAGTVSVGPHLHEILRHLRLKDGPRTLWIDAICINQSDLVERGEQVKEMHLIYMFASRVVIWLGEATDDSELALKKLEYIGKQIEQTSEGCMMPAPGCTEKDWWKNECRVPFSPPELVAIAHLVQRPYFERLWIVQEIQFANDLSIMQCGNVEVTWYHMRRAFSKFELDTAGLALFSSPLMQQKVEHIDDLAGDLRRMSYDVVFSIARNCQCGNSRDKIFSLLGLLPESIATRIEPQYSQPVKEIYIQAFLACVDVTKRLDLLEIARGINSVGGIPTWVPEFEPANDYARNTLVSFASSLSGAHVTIGNPGELLVQGVAQDDVDIVSPITPDTIHGIYEAARGLYKMIVESGLNMTEEAFTDAFLWVFSDCCLQDRFKESDYSPTLHRIRPMIQQIQRGEEPTIPIKYMQWYQDNLISTASMRFFFTRKGQFGCGLEDVKPGDKISVFLGRRLPTVIRRDNSSPDSSRYKIVGRCYVHGLMDGEALLGPLPSSWTVTIREIRAPLSGAWFHNKKKGTRSTLDPRLGTLPDKWEAIEKEDEARLGQHVQHYKNKVTGEIINSDPRLLPEALKARGVPIETFVLI